MNFLKIIFTLLLCIAYLACFSQENIYGRISMKEKEDLEFVRILLRSGKDSSIIKTIQPDTSGMFSINITSYNQGIFLEASAFGYTSEYLPITLPKQDSFEWNIMLNIQEQQLNDITINGKGPLIERKVDRIIFNVTNSIASNGSDVFELLKKLRAYK